MHTIGPAVRGWLNGRAHREELAVETVHTYRRHLTHLAAHLGPDTPIDDITPEHIEGWLDSMVDEWGELLAASTRRTRLHAARSFFRWAHEREMITRDPARLVHPPRRLRRSPTHGSWRAMIRRCTDPTNKRWKYYGGRGVTVCDEWLASFDAFLADMGERPEGKTLDRIDPNGNYEPGNCRWATAVEQRHNRRDSRDWPEIERTLRAPARPTESTPA